MLDPVKGVFLSMHLKILLSESAKFCLVIISPTCWNFVSVNLAYLINHCLSGQGLVILKFLAP